ncbi:midasin-like [Curcuma longa]|uniref:midasin-like n=1 Tax=Curcuma longa TaxID=136217 RepID=UPI003D9F09CA
MMLLVKQFLQQYNLSIFMSFWILTFGDGFLSEFLDVHATDLDHHKKKQKTQSAMGLKLPVEGMGEGEGVNDVSDQIEDESQLLGTSEKHDGQDELEK